MNKKRKHSLSPSFSFSPSLLLIHSLKLSIFHLSHFWQSHQLLHSKVTAHTQYAHYALHGVMVSKIKEIFKFHLSYFPKTYILRNLVTKPKSHQKYPNEFVRLQSFKPDSLSLPLFLPLSDLWEVGVKLCIPPERKEMLKNKN